MTIEIRLKFMETFPDTAQLRDRCPVVDSHRETVMDLSERIHNLHHYAKQDSSGEKARSDYQIRYDNHELAVKIAPYIEVPIMQEKPLIIPPYAREEFSECRYTGVISLIVFTINEFFSESRFPHLIVVFETWQFPSNKPRHNHATNARKECRPHQQAGHICIIDDLYSFWNIPKSHAVNL